MNAPDRKRLRAAVLRREAHRPEESTMHLIGIDIGNGTCVAVSEGRTAFFPSFYTTTTRGYQGVGVASDRHHIAYKGVNYVLGGGALELPRHDSLMNEALPENQAHERYITDQSFAAMLAAISVLYPDERHLDVTIGSGAPLSVYEPHGATIRARYIGQHEYAYMGRNRSLTIHDAAVFGESLEALRLLNADQIMGKVATHDIGARTYGVALHNNGELLRRKAYDAGIDRLMGDMAIISSDPGARWNIQQEMRRNARSTPEIRREIERTILETLKVIETKYPMFQADRHVVLGGGAVYAAPVIKARYGKPVIIVNKEAPEMANALAYLKAIEVR